MRIQEYEGKKYQQQKSSTVSNRLTVEAALQIAINGFPFTVTMRTPGNDKELIRGLLYSEDVYRKSGNSPEISYRKKNKVTTIANVKINKNDLGNGFKNSRSLLSVSSCGICGKQELDDISTYRDCLEDDRQLEITKLYTMFEDMTKQQDTFLKTGGSHAATAFDAKGNLLTVMEDIGRHNAVDKVVGHLINHSQLDDAVGLLISGRISYEIIAKTFSAGIPILAAVSAPSSLAVEYAKQFGVTLLAFCRGEKATCYANPQRIIAT
ncbi:MAG: formate dehydrogenase accessory sulfurtransferase FdhD [Aureispira sp.]|nr:formate dehydrogenase accessory sulfurtransferase FdhD [Aureispira sp.]